METPQEQNSNIVWIRKKVKKQLRKSGYVIGQSIGEGSFSKVYYSEFTRPDSQFPVRRACKIINQKDPSMDFSQFVPREINTMLALSHPNIVSVYSVLTFGPYVCIFMDYCQYGDLLQRIQSRSKLSEAEARLLFRQLVSAVSYMHSRGFCHRDIKCENILLSSPKQIKLTDFTFAKECSCEKASQQLSATFCGSVAYAAPEILKGIRYEPKLYDTWSLGCVLFIMLTGTMPFDESNIPEMIERQEWKRYNYPEGVRPNPTIIELIASLLEPDVNVRARIEQVVDCQWLQEVE